MLVLIHSVSEYKGCKGGQTLTLKIKIKNKLIRGRSVITKANKCHIYTWCRLYAFQFQLHGKCWHMESFLLESFLTCTLMLVVTLDMILTM